MVKYLLTTISSRFLQRAFMQIRSFTSEPSVQISSGIANSVAKLDRQRLYTLSEQKSLDTFDLICFTQAIHIKTFTLRNGTIEVPSHHFPDRHDCLTKELKLDWSIREETFMKKIIGDNDIEHIKWKHIQKKLKRKSISQIKEYYERVIEPTLKVKDDATKPNKFSEEEDAALIAAVKKHGTGSFYTIKNEMNSTRSHADLRRRYDNYLDPAVAREEWPVPRNCEDYSQKYSRGKYRYYRTRIQSMWL